MILNALLMCLEWLMAWLLGATLLALGLGAILGLCRMVFAEDWERAERSEADYLQDNDEA